MGDPANGVVRRNGRIKIAPELTPAVLLDFISGGKRRWNLTLTIAPGKCSERGRQAHRSTSSAHNHPRTLSAGNVDIFGRRLNVHLITFNCDTKRFDKQHVEFAKGGWKACSLQ
jgi:hypothetical protein